MIADTTNVASDPLSPPAPTTQLPADTNETPQTTNFATGEEGSDGNDDEFSVPHDHTHFRLFLRYTHAVLALLSAVVLDFTSANNKSIASKIIRIIVTALTYGMIYTSATGFLMLAIVYLMDHGWYLLAVACSIVLLLLCGILLAFCEWMWQWQGRFTSFLSVGSDNFSNIGYNRLRSVNILDDDGMEDDLTLRKLIKQIVHALVTSLIWSLYCVLSAKLAFWITDHYEMARPTFHPIELRLVSCFEAAPVLLGAALLLYYAYPSFYRWSCCLERASHSRDVTETVDALAVPFSLTEDPNDERYTIVVDDDNEVTQSLII